MFSARVLADSVSDLSCRLTTMEVTFPRIILSEFNTHRVFSRNSASSRAMPVEKMIKRVEETPYIPSEWGTNQKGMQAGKPLSRQESALCARQWLAARDSAVFHAKYLLEKGVHKQLTNRLLEPFMWHTVIVSSTDWSNFFNLRTHPDAHPDMRTVAKLMQHCYHASTPRLLARGQWHLPLLTDEERREAEYVEKWNYWVKVSVGRCARVSYLTHDGMRDPQADVQLHDRLLKAGHLSPFEHVARPSTKALFFGNFYGWTQYRKLVPGERDILSESNSGRLASRLKVEKNRGQL